MSLRRVEYFGLQPTGGGYEEVKEGEAFFHSWGVEYEEFEGGPGNFSVAILEQDNGQIATVPAHMIRFMDRQGEVQCKDNA